MNKPKDVDVIIDIPDTDDNSNWKIHIAGTPVKILSFLTSTLYNTAMDLKIPVDDLIEHTISAFRKFEEIDNES